MSREKELVKNTLIISMGTFLPQLFNFITIPILTGFLSVEEYGTYDLIVTIVSLFLPIVTFQIQSAAFRFLIESRKDVNKCKKIISSVVFFVFVVSLISLIIFYFLWYKQTILMKILMSLYLLLEVFYNVFGQIIRGLSNNKGYAQSALLLSMVKTILFFISIAVLNKGLEGILFSFCGAYLLADIFLIVKNRLCSYISIKNVSYIEIKKMLRYSWPMVPNNISGWILKMSDRFVITYYLGVSYNAIYAAANIVPNIVNLARTVFVMAWQENASLAVEDEDSEVYYSKIFEVTFSLVTGITALLIALTPLLFKILIRGEYEEAYYQMPILFMGTFFGCISAFQGGIYIAHKKTLNGGFSMITAAFINLIVDLLLIKHINIYAGSVSTLISYLVLFVFRVFDIQRFQKINYKYGEILKQICMLTVMCIICSFNHVWTNMLNIVVGFIFSVYINRKLIRDIGKKIK